MERNRNATNWPSSLLQLGIISRKDELKQTNKIQYITT